MSEMWRLREFPAVEADSIHPFVLRHPADDKAKQLFAKEFHILPDANT